MVSIGCGHWTTTQVLFSFLISFGITCGMLYQWVQGSKDLDEAFARNRHLTPAGWAHALYMVIALEVLILFYWFTPREFSSSLIRAIMSIALMVHVVLGIALPDLNTNKTLHKGTIITVIVAWLLILVCWLH